MSPHLARLVAHLKWRIMYATTDVERQAYVAALASLVLP